MNSLDCFMSVAPVINEMTNGDVIMNVWTNGSILIGSPIEDEEKLVLKAIAAKSVIETPGVEFNERLYKLQAIPLISDTKEITGIVVLYRGASNPDLTIALVDNLKATMNQMFDTGDTLSSNMKRIELLSDDLEKDSKESIQLKSIKEIKSLAIEQEMLYGYIEELGKLATKRLRRLKEQLLSQN